MRFQSKSSNSKLTMMRMMKSFTKKKLMEERNTIEGQHRKLTETMFALILPVKKCMDQKEA